MLHVQKRVRVDKMAVLGRFWEEMTVMPRFFNGSSVDKVAEHEKLLHTKSMGNRISMFLVVKKHWDHYQVVHDCAQRSEAVSPLENNR